MNTYKLEVCLDGGHSTLDDYCQVEVNENTAFAFTCFLISEKNIVVGHVPVDNLGIAVE